MTQLPRGLIEDYKEKTGLTKWALYKGAKKVQEEQGGTISMRIAAGVVAGKEKVETQRHLDKEELGTVREILSKTVVPTAPTPSPAASTARYVLKVQDREFEAPLLPRSVVADAKRMAQVYPVLYIFENSVRAFVRLILKEQFGEDWWEKGVSKNIKNSVAGREAKDGAEAWYGKRGADELCYTLIADLAKIVRRNITLFQPYFKEVTSGVDFLLIKIQEIEKVRNTVAHHNSLTDDDIKLIELYWRQWRQQLGAMEDQLPAVQ